MNSNFRGVEGENMPDDLFIQRCTVLTPFEVFPDSFIHLRGGKIARLEPYREQTLPLGSQVIDAAGLFATPGWIDIQVNGGYGLDFTQNPASIWEVASRLAHTGTTSFLPTIITSPLETVSRALEVVKGGPPRGWKGAHPLGIHAEGPFLNPGKKGAHNPSHMRLPEPGLMENWTFKDGMRLVTLAPELPGGMEAVRFLRAQGVSVSIGHSLAIYEEALEAFAAGVSSVTHLYNAMPQLKHRDPGLAAAALLNSDVRVGLIADGVHCHPAMLQLAWKLKGASGICLVTDAMAAQGMPPGTYRLGDFDVHVDQNSARLQDGTLAGSILTQAQALRNIMHWCGASLIEVIPALTSTPAALLGLHGKGLLALGADADLVLVTPEGEVKTVFVDGKVIRK
jgi:N-acetylglucosamine-6-phosphate deacetylase